MIAALHLAPPDIAVLSCQKVSQVIGETDRQRKVPTDNRTESRFGLKGTDLGASFEHEGKLVFLFGDTWPVGPHTPDRPVDGDSLAFCRDTNSDRGLTLDFVKAADGRYATIRLPNVSNGAFEVPNGGFSHDSWMHVFYTTDARFEPYGVTMGRCVLIRSRDGLKWELVYTVSTDKFINVAPVEVDCAKIEGLPQKTGRGLLLWASGREYRRSSPCLAFIPLDKLADRNQMRYWTGKDWSIREEEARPLFHHPMVGEISVAYCEPLKCWLMTYNVEQPRSVLLRAADSPLGPWSDAKILTTNADALGRYMHAAGKRDGLSDPGREDQNGDFYGPYLIPRFFKGDRREATIDFLLSTWNPYAVMLMRARLRLEGDAPDLPLR